MEGINFRGVINVLAGQYLFYLAYKMFRNPEIPVESRTLILIFSAIFALCGFGLVIFGIVQIVRTYREYRNEHE